MRRVVVTGMGMVSALGNSPRAAFERLKRLENTIAVQSELFEIKGLQTHLGSRISFTRPEHYTRKVVRTMGDLAVNALYASETALEMAGLLGSEELKSGRTGVAYGSSAGSVKETSDFYTLFLTKAVRDITSSTYLKVMPHTTAVNLSVHFGTTGRLIPTSTACTSGSLAIGNAFECIRSGAQDIMIAGGADEYGAAHVAIFDTLFATSRRDDRPDLTPRAFDRHRDGLVVGEGAATLILEEREHALERGAEILAEIVGFGTNTDGRHVTQPNAETMRRAMELSLESAALTPSDIGYINAHGTATSRGDVAEGTATASLFGASTPVSTIKNYTGHTLGACGAIESILTIMMMREKWFVPNLNLEDPDPECGNLDFIMGEGRQFDCRFAMNNNFAFGGINTSLIFGLA